MSVTNLFVLAEVCLAATLLWVGLSQHSSPEPVPVRVRSKQNLK